MSIAVAIRMSPGVAINHPLRLAQEGERRAACVHAAGDRVQDGSLAQISGAAGKVFVAIEGVADPRGEASPALITIARLAGVAPSTVSVAIAELVSRGFIERVSRGGGRATTCYRVLHQHAHRSNRGARPGGQQVSAPPGTCRPAERARALTLSLPSDSAQTISSSSAAAGVANREESQAIARKRGSLLRAGIGDPALTELSCSPWLSPSQVDDKVNAAKSRGKGTGIIVNDLKALIEKNKADAVRKQSQPPRPAQLAAPPPAAETNGRDAELRAAEQRLRQLPPEEIAHIARAAIETLPPFERRRVDRNSGMANPLGCRSLGPAMCNVLLAREAGGGAVPAHVAAPLPSAPARGGRGG